MALDATVPRADSNPAPTSSSSRPFLAPLITLGLASMMAMTAGSVVVFALPTIQNELGLSDAARGWVITAYLLTYGGLVLLGGRLGDTIGRKRALILGLALFTIGSVLCGVAWNGGVLVLARLLHGAAAAILGPISLALVATTFPKGSARNAAVAIFGALSGLGAVIGLMAGGFLTEVSWRLAFLINVPAGLLTIYLAYTTLEETQKDRMKLDVAGSVLATTAFVAAVFGFATAPETGWLSVTTIGLGLAALAAAAGFVMVERRAENPIVPFSLFTDRNRLATFAALFLAGGLMFTLSVLLALFMQNTMGFSPLQAAIGYIPFVIAVAIGVTVSTRLVTRFPPRVMVVAGCMLVLSATIYGGTTLERGTTYFPTMLFIAVGAIGMGMINVPLGLGWIASVSADRIGPTSAIAVMLQTLGGPVVLIVIQVIITMRTLQLGGTTGPVADMDAAQLHALDGGYTFGLLCMGGVVVLLALVASCIGYTAEQVAHAQKLQNEIGDDGAVDVDVDGESVVDADVDAKVLQFDSAGDAESRDFDDR